eukprot:235700-Pyramimonas_sp.AAC.1
MDRCNDPPRAITSFFSNWKSQGVVCCTTYGQRRRPRAPTLNYRRKQKVLRCNNFVFLQLEIPGVFSLHHTPCPSTTSEVDPSLGMNPSGCVVQYTRGKNVQNAKSYQRCQHPWRGSTGVQYKSVGDQ